MFVSAVKIKKKKEKKVHLVVVIRTFQYRQYWESVCAYELYPFVRLLQ